ncbi:FeoA family protein [Methanococcus aeolicus]|uniref:FeoA family protein n=1 Tax=Methanococcus aeolicus TaxID=42879 RepID=UPI0021C96489|nr:FeoA family protein [Methanococcus aeolicus]UXM85046.1 ferrous iron transport protein A [Methanococcus aeolicus]
MFPLALAKEGDKVIIKDTGGRLGIATKLTDMGLTLNCKVVVVRNQRAGPLIVFSKGTNIAIGRGIAMKILVGECNEA